MKDRTDEKNRLWKEVMGKNRTYDSSEDASDITLSLDDEKKSSSDSSGILKDADSAMNALMDILNRQNKELKKMSEDIKESEPVKPADTMMSDLDALQKDLQNDYSVQKHVEIKAEDTGKVFQEVEKAVNEKIIGQKEAVSAVCTAIRRPFVMGQNEGMPANVILIYGSEGTGRHETLLKTARLCKEKNILPSSSVSTIDMSRYTSGAQEQIFLQDLYQAIAGESRIICFEGFESSFAGFNRMVTDLVTKGKIVLSKRYVLSQGILVENQTGLVKSSIDSLSAEGKYLVFITGNKISTVQDTFGADFMYHVLDRIHFESLKEEDYEKVICSECDNFIQKCKEQLRIQITSDNSVNTWIKDNFDKTKGVEGITSLFYDFYVSASEAVLHAVTDKDASALISVKDGKPIIDIQGNVTVLSRSRNSLEEIEAVNKELDEIVGLDEVKNYIRSLQAHIAMNEKRKQQGLKTASVSMHMIFTGNPGTGKTTIARLLSRYMKAIGALSVGQLVEVTRADLVAQYVGQTAPLTMSVIKSAMGGVLFIDEAYSLYRGKDDSFGLEAIDTLVKAMEDNRDNLIVILAGYKKEMAGFLEANSGLKSRFPNVVNFPDYTGEELVRIADIQAKSKGYVIDADAKEKLKAYFDKVQATEASEAGNGRLARNTIEEAILAQSGRIVNEDNPDLSLLKDEDFKVE